MKFSRNKIFIAAAALLVLGAVAVSQTIHRASYGHGRGMFGDHMLGFYAHKLDLTDAQQAQMKDIMAKQKPAMKPLMQQMAQTNQQLRQLAMNGNFDEAQVRALATQQSQAMTEMIVQRTRIESEMMQVLTADQKTKLKTMMDEHAQRMQHHRQQQSTDNQPQQ